MVNLSVNVNKVATLRNSRGGSRPRVIDAVAIAIEAGAAGVTVHPRADERHIRRSDVLDIAGLLRERTSLALSHVELNIEGDPRPDLMDLVVDVRPDQCTLVPVQPGEITSQAGWPPGGHDDDLRRAVDRLRAAGVRVAVFVDPESDAVRWAADLGADRVELYTEPFARAFASGRDEGRAAFERYRQASATAREAGLGINAGHDLDLENLVLFRQLPHLAEVSIGHALIAHALWVGLAQAVRDYLAVIRGA